MKMKYLIITLFLILGNLYALNVSLNETIDVSEIDNIDKIYAHDNQIFIAFEIESGIWRYEINYKEKELDKIRSFGDFNGIKDMWLDENIAYVLDYNYVYKINYETRKELFKGNSDSYFPEDPHSITINNNGEYIYAIDKENNRINILYEYDEDEYLSKGSISMSTHGIVAYFEELSDIAIDQEKMYILDKGLEQVNIYENVEPYEYIDVLASGKKGYSSKRPSKIEVDEFFVYILEQYDEKITLMDKNTGENILSLEEICETEIEDFAYDNDKIYVLCSNKENLLIYDVDKRITKTKEQVETLL